MAGWQGRENFSWTFGHKNILKFHSVSSRDALEKGQLEKCWLEKCQREK